MVNREVTVVVKTTFNSITPTDGFDVFLDDEKLLNTGRRPRFPYRAPETSTSTISMRLGAGSRHTITVIPRSSDTWEISVRDTRSGKILQLDHPKESGSFTVTPLTDAERQISTTKKFDTKFSFRGSLPSGSDDRGGKAFLKDAETGEILASLGVTLRSRQSKNSDSSETVVPLSVGNYIIRLEELSASTGTFLDARVSFNGKTVGKASLGLNPGMIASTEEVFAFTVQEVLAATKPSINIKVIK